MSDHMNMARRSDARKESVPPTLPPYQAIELLRRQLSEFDRVNALRRDDPDLKKWMTTTGAILDGAFGKPDGDSHELTKKFKYFYGISYMGRSDEYYEHEHHKEMFQKKAVLESCIEQLEILAPPSAQTAPDQYRFHPEIERVTGGLYRDGHYKQAALEAYIRVIEEVKRRSALNLDGDSLMNQAFGCENRQPTIKLNTLASEAERDEQKGFMFLYKGIVSLRNSKAHSNRLFNDPHRAHEYLALASVLMRILE